MNAILGEHKWDNVKLPGRRVRVAFSESPDSTHGKLIAQFKRDYEHAIEGKRERVNMARRSYKHYRSHLNAATHQFTTKVYDPYWFSAVNTAIARKMATLFGAGPFLTYLPRGRSDVGQARKYTLSFAYHWEKQKARSKVHNLQTQLHLFGTAYAAVFWAEEWTECLDWVEDLIEMPVPTEEVDEFGQPIETTVSTTARRLESVRRRTLNSPVFEPIHFLDAYPDWEAETVDAGRYFIHAKLRSRDYVEEMMRTGTWNRAMCKQLLADSAEAFAGSSTSSFGVEDSIIGWQQEVGLMASAGEMLSAGRMFEVAEHITNQGVAVIVNRRYVVKYQKGLPMGRKPILHIKHHHIPGEHYGMSDFEVVEKLIIHLQNMRNCSATEAVFSVFAPLLVKQSVTNKDLLVYKPGAKWPVTGPDDVRVLERPTQGIQVAEQQTGTARSAIDDALATSDAYRGALPGREQKATAITTSVQAAGIRLQLETELFEEAFTVPLGEMFRDLMKLMQDEKISVRITEEQGAVEEVYPEELYDCDLDVMPVAGSSQLKELETKRLLEFLQMAMNYPEAKEQLDIREALRVFAERLIPKDVNRIFLTPEQVAANQQQAMMQQMMMQQAQAQQQPGAPPPSNRMSDKPDDAGAEEMAKQQGEAMSL